MKPIFPVQFGEDTYPEKYPNLNVDLPNTSFVALKLSSKI